MRKLFIAAIAVVLSGCAGLGLSGATEKLIVQAATMKFIESGDAPAERSAKAARIARAADQARIWLDTDDVTVADLQSAMLERIRSADLEPSDKVLASALVEVVVAELNIRIGEGIISPDKRATVNAVLAWVEQAAKFYVYDPASA